MPVMKVSATNLFVLAVVAGFGLGARALGQPAAPSGLLGVIGGPPWNGVRTSAVVARSPAWDLGLEAAKAAAEACAGFHVGVSIIDAAGLPKLYYIPDGTSGTHALTAFRKANTALLIRGPSESVVEAVKTDKALAGKVTGNPDYISYAGGLPIAVGSEVIGAIGVSGAEPSAKDEACAAAGLAKIQARLR